MQMTVEIMSSFPVSSKGLCFQIIQPILEKQELMKLKKNPKRNQNKTRSWYGRWWFHSWLLLI